MANSKICSCCGKPFPKAEFGKNRQTPDGLAYYTRAHAAAKQKIFRVNNPVLVKEARDRYLDKLRARNTHD
jgi:hypothetical protein